MSAVALLARLDDMRRAGRWLARWPSHLDKRRSLSVRERETAEGRTP